MNTWDALGQAMSLTPQAVQERAMRTLIEVELAQLDREEIALIQTYNLLSAAELEQAMQSRSVPEHLTWEDLIHWEAIEDRRKALKVILRNGLGRTQ